MRTALLRRGVARTTGVLVASAVAGAGIVASTTAAYAEETTPDVSVRSFDATEFTDEAAKLPSKLTDAIKRDLKISPEQYLADAESAKVASDVAANLRTKGVGVLGSSVDGQKITVHVENESDVAAAAATGAEVKVGHKTRDFSDVDFIAHVANKGGYGYYLANEDDSESGVCSVGFNGFDSKGGDRFLTAGHCAQPPESDGTLTQAHQLKEEKPLSTGEKEEFLGPELGNVVESTVKFGAGVDSALVDITNPEIEPEPKVAGWGTRDGNRDEDNIGIYGSIDAVEGAKVCKSGVASGFTCGEILKAEEEIKVDGIPVTSIVTSACTISGDSGGSVIVGNYALGVSSGSTDDGSNCDGWNGEDFANVFPITGATNNAMDTYGQYWELSVLVSTPKLTTPSAKGHKTGAMPVFEGSVDKASSKHRVRVTIDDNKDTAYFSMVKPNGTFSVPVTDALKPGVHTYKVQAFYGKNSSGKVLEGTINVIDVEDLKVESPENGQTTANPRPTFEGTGEPGAKITLSIGEGAIGDTVVDEDGSWSVTPESDLPVGDRFDVIVTQDADGQVTTVTVSDLGVQAPANDDEKDDDKKDDDKGEDQKESGKNEELPDTGSSSLPLILIAVGLLVAGGVAVALRARRNSEAS